MALILRALIAGAIATGTAGAQTTTVSSFGDPAASAQSSKTHFPIGPGPAADCRRRRSAYQDRAVANDNRNSVGKSEDRTITLHLVMREARWYPDGRGGCALRVHAFAEEGHSAQIPGPLIRVHAGTTLRVSVRNALSKVLWVRGLQDRASGVLDSAEVAPASTRVFTFRASAPGAWYYWAGAVTARVPASGEDGQLVGGFVVDSSTSLGTSVVTTRGDRVFILTRWTPEGTPGNRGFQLNAINGRSWPYTERLSYSQGDSVRWQVINASDALHMMHLHGFYYRVVSRGDAAHDSALSREQQNFGVTAALRRGEWMSIAWAADRPGNWLFHCHILTHMSAQQQLEPASAERVAHMTMTLPGVAATAPAVHSMAGLVLGVTVRPAGGVGGGPQTIARRIPSNPRVIHLFADVRPRVFGERPGFGFVVQDGKQPTPDSIRIPGTPIVLTRGEPVAIVVHNRLATPLGVHWHGIELESYYDGVPGWSGLESTVAPMIAPGDSFVARFTPPRAGTFMYHVHSEAGEELASGLYAPLLVFEPGRTFDPNSERLFVIATGGPGADAPTFINGSAVPDTLTMRSGVAYRLRVIDISANEAHAITLRGPDGVALWRLLARDGRDVPPDRRALQTGRENVAAGVTRDFEFTPPAPGMYSFSVATIVGGKLTDKVVSVPLDVRAQ